MASVAPELPPIQEFAPLEITEKFSKTRISNEGEHKLESGAPATKAEANLFASQQQDPANYCATTDGSAAKPNSAAVKMHNFEIAVETVGNKLVKDPASINKKDAAFLESREARAIGHRPNADSISAEVKRLATHNEKSKEKDGSEDEATQTETASAKEPLPPIIQSHLDKEKNFQEAIDIIQPKVGMAPETITKEDANLLVSREARAHGNVEEGGIAAQVQSLAVKNEKDGKTA